MRRTKNKPSRLLNDSMSSAYRKYFNLEYLKKLVFDPEHVAFACWCLLLFEVVLNVFVIERVKYTEIDWVAYMQEVEGFLNGTLDYKELRGDTGPLVYPAGFVYIYTLFYYVTSFGKNIRLAQYIFLVIFLLQQYLTYEIYKKTCKVPAYALALATLASYRIHSIYVLRLFNDPIAVLFFYASLNSFLKNKWILGSFLYSLAVSIKMNILLYAPCLLIAYLTNLGVKGTVLNLFVCGFVQLLLGAPFLYGNAWSYVKGSFDLGRIFEHKWTVNYRFLEVDVFESRYFHVGLLILHLSILGMFLPSIVKYLSSYAKLNYVIGNLKTQVKSARKPESRGKKNRQMINEKRANEKQTHEKRPANEEPEVLSKDQQDFLNMFEKQLKNGNTKIRGGKKPIEKPPPPPPVEEETTEKDQINFSRVTQLFVLPFFVTNLIGIACARSLHYQFYSWYFHSLLYLSFSTPFSKPVAFLILGVIEFCWNTYPSTDVSSGLLHGCHAFLLYGLFRTMRQ